MAEETWRILISDEAGDVGGGGGGGGGKQSSDTALPPSQKNFFENASANFTLWKPFIQVGGLLYTMYKASSLVNAATKGMWDILKAMMDVVLLPLQPIVIKIFEALSPLVSKIGELSKAFLDPIVDWIMPKLEALIAWSDTWDWAAWTTKFEKAGNDLVGKLDLVYEWLTTTAIPKVTEWAGEIKSIWENEGSFVSKLVASWGVIWDDIKPMAETAWEGIKTYWVENIWHKIEEAWVAAKDFWDDTLLPKIVIWLNETFLPALEDFWDLHVFPMLKDFWDNKVFTEVQKHWKNIEDWAIENVFKPIKDTAIEFWLNISRISAIIWDIILLKANDVWDDISWAFNAYILTPVAKSWDVITRAIGETWKSITDYVKESWVYISETLVPYIFWNLPGYIADAMINGIERVLFPNSQTAPVFKDFPTFNWDETGFGSGKVSKELGDVWGSDLAAARKERQTARADRNFNIVFENYGPIIGADDSAVTAFWQEVEDRIWSILNSDIQGGGQSTSDALLHNGGPV